MPCVLPSLSPKCWAWLGLWAPTCPWPITAHLLHWGEQTESLSGRNRNPKEAGETPELEGPARSTLFLYGTIPHQTSGQPPVGSGCERATLTMDMCACLVFQSYLTLCNPMKYTVHGISQARILEWVALPFSRGSSQPRDWIWVSSTAGRFFTSWATRECLNKCLSNLLSLLFLVVEPIY